LADQAVLERALDRARHLGFLGPGPIRAQIEHAERYGAGLDGLDGGSDSGDPGRVGLHGADLGSGGGLPALPLLVERPELSMILVDAVQKRWAFLVWALVELELTDRAHAWCGRAEDLGHQPEHRDRYDVVTARGFGRPAQTVECAAPLLRPGGRLVVSEPPGGRRWPADGLARAGLEEVARHEGIVVFERRGSIPEVLPRPNRDQRRRPLFDP
jgi:SAM-dependent methyltransferase